ncbi:hypothetical protein BHM03_00002383 [Ensete ventricosum]|nr:hypothetical protein BHM03_00002383 [Ensete ventricosum]
MRLRIRRSNVLGGIRQAVSGSYVPDAGVGAAVASSKVLDNGGSVAVSSRHLKSTPESFVIFLALEGGLMSQERLTSNPNSEHPGESTYVFPSTLQPVGQAPRLPTEEASTILPTLNRYWRLFNDPGLAPPDPGLSPTTPGLGPPIMTAEAFVGLTQ